MDRREFGYEAGWCWCAVEVDRDAYVLALLHVPIRGRALTHLWASQARPGEGQAWGRRVRLD